MRRFLVLALVGALALVANPAQANPYFKDGRVDSWLKYDHSVVGREQVNVSPTPRLVLSMSPGTGQAVAWRVTNLRHARSILFVGCQGDDAIALRYFTPQGEPISGEVIHHRYSVTGVHKGTSKTVEVRVHALEPNSSLRCVLRGYGKGGVDRVVLKVQT
jgi:hypothetical protein